MKRETYTLRLGDKITDGLQNRVFLVGAVCKFGYVLIYEKTSTGLGLVLWRKSEKYDFVPLAVDKRFSHFIPMNFLTHIKGK